jgi:T1SS-143 domain-containing protein
MNAPFILAQLGATNPATPRVIRLAKPASEQAIVINLDGSVRFDLAGIADEKVTFVHVGNRLVILFDNQATVTVEPFFGSDGRPLQDITFDLGPNRIVSGAEFATLFPISDDQSILPAAGQQGGARSSANFSDHGPIDPLNSNNPLDLLGGEPGSAGLGANESETAAAAAVITPTITGGATGTVDEDGLSNGLADGPGDVPGNETSASGSLNIDFGADAAGRSLAFSASQPALSGLTSGGQPVDFVLTTVGGLPAIVGYVGGFTIESGTEVYIVTLDAGPEAGAFTFTLLRPLDQPTAGTEDSIVLAINFIATDGSGDSADLTLSIAVNDDSPIANDIAFSEVISQETQLTVNLIAGVDYQFGADGPASAGAISVGTPTVTNGPVGDSFGTPTVVVGPDGHSVEMTPNGAFAALGAGEQATVHIPYTVTDRDGDSVTRDITVTVTGVNDAPTDLALSPSTIPAGNAAGYRVGEITVTDPDDTSGFSFSVADSRFTVVTETVSGVEHYYLETTGPVTSLPPSIGLTVTDAGGLPYTEGMVITLPVQLYTNDELTLLGSFSTIQAAVNAAAEGNHILIGAGHYAEQVVIDPSNGRGADGIALIGVGAVFVDAPDVLFTKGTSPTNGNALASLITVKGAADIFIQGITVDGLGRGDSEHLGPAEAQQMIGIAYLDSSGTVENVTVTGIRESYGQIGNQRNLGIYVSNTDPTPGTPAPTSLEVDALKTITIANSTVTEFQKGGIVVVNANVDIHGNTITGIGASIQAQNGIQVSGSVGSIADNVLTNMGTTAEGWASTNILTFNSRGLVITGNTITSALDSNGDVLGSTIGVYLQDSTGGTVSDNTIHQTAYGVAAYAGGLSGSWAITGNVVDGIHADGAGIYFDPPDVSGIGFDDVIIVNGTGVADVIAVTPGEDTVAAGQGDDILVVKRGLQLGQFVDSVDGGAGSNKLLFTSQVASDTLTLGAKVSNIAEVDLVDASWSASDTTAKNVEASSFGAGLKIVGNEGANEFSATQFADIINAAGGNDTLGGNGGDDALDGGANIDTAWYAQAIGAGMIATNGLGGWTVTTGGAEGTDTLSNIEIVNGLEAGRFLLVGNGGFATLADAYTAALDGDTIVLAPGTYTGDFTISKAVSIVGANFGKDGTDPSRGPESIIDGNWVVNAAGAVIIDGVRFLNDEAPTSPDAATLTFNSAAGHVVRNSVFFSTIDGGDQTAADLDPVVQAYAVVINGALGSGAITVEGNYLTGSHTGKYGDAAWARGVSYTSAGPTFVTLDISDNTFEFNRSAINTGGTPGAAGSLTIDGNTFTDNGTGITLSNATGTLDRITGNTFTNVDNEFNARFAGAITVDFGGQANSSNQYFSVLGGQGGDTFLGTTGQDAVLTNAGDDTVHTGAADDTVFVNAGTGSDIVDGGSETGKDTLVVSNVNVSGGVGNALDPGEVGPPDTTTSGAPSATRVTFTMTPDSPDTVHPTDGPDATEDILITMAQTSGGAPLGQVRADGIEDVRFNLGTNGDTINISGDFSNTSLAMATITVQGGAGADIVNAGDLISPHQVVFTGGGGDDIFTSGDGDDNFNGGQNTDTLIYGTDFDLGDIEFNGTSLVIDCNRGRDTITGVERIQFDDATVLIVDNNPVHYDGAYSTIGAALTAANAISGHVAILVVAGTYNENVSITRADTAIIGQGDGTVIQGTFRADNGGFAGATADWLKTAAGYSPNSGAGVTIAADDVTVQGLKIDGFYVGIDLANGTDGARVEGVTIEDTVNGILKGSGAAVSDFELFGGTIADSYIGIYFAKDTASGLDIEGVHIAGTSFSNLTEKGIYAETLSNALISGITMTDVGEFGRAPAFGSPGQLGGFGAGIDLNLKWDFESTTDTVEDPNAHYSGITITGFTFTDVGSSNRDGAAASHDFGAAITVKARDAGSYASPEKASFDGAIVIQNGTINGTSIGIRAGEPGQTITDPDVTVSGVTITGADVADVNNVTLSVLTVNMTAASETLTTAATATGSIVVHGNGGADDITTGQGADTLDGGADNDTLDGKAGFDTALFSGAYAAATIGLNAGTITVTSQDGLDTLNGIERLQFADRGLLIVDATGTYGFSSVQAAIDAAQAGDAIWVLPGTYTETSEYVPGDDQGLYINKAGLTLQGVKADGSLIATAADAQTFGATIIAGAQNMFGANHWIDVGGDGTTIQGLHLQAGPETDNKLLEIWADGVTVTNSFLDVYVGGSAYSGAAAIYVNDTGVGAADEVTTYNIGGNILNEGIVLASGVGDPTGGAVGANQRITDNAFIGAFDDNTGLGRYDTIVINGNVPGVGWMVEAVQLPTVSGNSIADNSVPILFRIWEENPAYLPTAAQVATIVTGLTAASNSFAYLLNGAAIDTFERLSLNGVDTSPFFLVTNSIATLNLAQDTTGDAVFGGKRVDMAAGDTIVVQSVGTTDETIVVDGLKVLASASSTDLNLMLGTMLPDGTPSVVQSLTLLDYASGLGADVDVTGNALANVITGNSGANILSGAGGIDTLIGGDGNDTYYADSSDSIVEGNGANSGVDEIRITDSYTLGANVENLTLLDGATHTDNFTNFDIGPISNGENGWKVGGSRDQGVVDDNGNHVFRMSSDPSSPDYQGPYSVALPFTAGEPSTTADYNAQSIAFRFKAVDPSGDNSRLEIDFGTEAGNDRNDFMVIEATAAGIRIAVNEPLLDGNWANNSFTAFTGNVTLASGASLSAWHDIELRLSYIDGPDNDLIQVYLDGQHIGTTTTFENYRDALGGLHVDNAEANQTNRIFFQPSANGAPVDGPGGLNEGFLFDDLTTSVYNDADGFGNELANVITGNSGNNTLLGLDGIDTLAGGLGNDTLIGGNAADIFKFSEAGAANVDRIFDYSGSGSGDMIDVSALLDPNFTTGDAEADFIRLWNAGSDVKVQVDVDGAGSGATWTDVAVLDNYHHVGQQVLVQFEQEVHQLTVAA